MKLYHGTTEAVGRQALEEGLKPRKMLRKVGKHHGNWKHTVQSRADAIYLTTVYAPYFAMNAAAQDKFGAVIEIESDLLSEYNLVPDEDAMEQALRKTDELPKDWSMQRRTKHYRDSLHEYIGHEQWKSSLQALGTCAHIGPIPGFAVTRVAIFDYKKNKQWAVTCMDPTISIINFRLMETKYATLTAALFGDPLPDMPEQDKFVVEQIRQQLSEMGRDPSEYKSVWDTAREFDRSGVEILHGKTS